MRYLRFCLSESIGRLAAIGDSASLRNATHGEPCRWWGVGHPEGVSAAAETGARQKKREREDEKRASHERESERIERMKARGEREPE